MTVNKTKKQAKDGFCAAEGKQYIKPKTNTVVCHGNEKSDTVIFLRS